MCGPGIEVAGRHVRPRADDHAARAASAPRTPATRCSCSRPPSPRRSSSGTRSARSAAGATRGASTARRPAPRASAGATARFPRSGAATPRASRRRTRPARAGGRCTPPCRCTQSTRSIALRIAAHVVDVVRVAVVGGVDRDDRVERGRALHRDLDRVEAAPRRPVHADLARAPVLLGEPGDHLADVGLLLRVVLVERDPLRRARPAEVEPADREAALRRTAARTRSRTTRSGRPCGTGAHRATPAPGARREEEARGEPRAVLHRDPGVPVLHARRSYGASTIARGWISG